MAKIFALSWGLFFCFLVFFILFFNQPSHILTIKTSQGHHKIRVELAKKPKEKQKGLMGRKTLAENTGMLFDFRDDPRPIMWMKNMFISLDMVFISKNGKITQVLENVPPCMTEEAHCLRYSADSPSDFVLELPAHYCSKYNITTESEVLLPSGI